MLPATTFSTTCSRGRADSTQTGLRAGRADWVGTTAGLGASQKRPFSLPEIERRFVRLTACSPVRVLTALPLLHVVLNEVAGGIIETGTNRN